ncbi:hypothetical protein CJF42_23720 [Pseudoalteromonas sp. NBT06-2]|uniref:hypothetical protein n=1 Tax=Pseudoalteromonas sp. NBT06-2 TaxID=2025950 RepID=UPI000BA691F1|nr:hypothetical protein [Pseudoalteromonas sp. NBT06-2]PAJ71979.1 hypothetical protein CJF42_23720 [Pseudoalteromonas sp. NBT06-2]
MALTLNIAADNGLNLPDAVLVIDQLNVTKHISDGYTLSLNATPEGAIYQANNIPKESTGLAFRVQIFANEDMVRQGKQPICQLPNDKQPNQALFTLQLDTNNTEQPLALAYAHIQNLYPKAQVCDLADIGVQ